MPGRHEQQDAFHCHPYHAAGERNGILPAACHDSDSRCAAITYQHPLPSAYPAAHMDTDLHIYTDTDANIYKHLHTDLYANTYIHPHADLY